MEAFGDDLDKWYITRSKSPDNRWHVCPPVTDESFWWAEGRSFRTGAEALAAFAKGM